MVDSTYFVKYNDDLRQSHENSLRFKGPIYMIVNRNTFSSAAMMAAAFKCYNMGVLVGQETGGTQIFYDEPILLELRNTKLKYLVSYQYRTCACGNSGVEGIKPDFEIPWNYEDRLSGIDSELKFIRNHHRGNFSK